MIIQSKRVYINEEFVAKQIEIIDEKIVSFYDYNEKQADKDYGDLRIVPGFYDVHTHGYDGFDTNDGNEEGLRHWLEEIVKEGVCGICPTTITQSHEILSKAVKNVAKVNREGYKGAEILGIHFEGPYLDKKYKGAQPEEFCIDADVEEFKEYQKDAEGLIKIVTVAPEHDKDHKLVKYCASTNVNASIGHTNATFEEAISAVKDGARSFTHVYNGMTPFTHRANGVVGAAFVSDEAYSEIICDGNHSTIDALKIFFKQKPKDKTIMISDSLVAKGKPIGSIFSSGGQSITIYQDGSCHIVESGIFAGSTLRINEGLKILVEKANVPFDKAIASCTINPMNYLGLGDHKGLIKEGYDANITVLKDDYSVEQTYVLGKESF